MPLHHRSGFFFKNGGEEIFREKRARRDFFKMGAKRFFEKKGGEEIFREKRGRRDFCFKNGGEAIFREKRGRRDFREI